MGPFKDGPVPARQAAVIARGEWEEMIVMEKTSRIPSGLRTIAYFSMEVGIDPAIPTYRGGLGVLAGDTLRAAGDLAFPMVGVTLLHVEGVNG